MPLKIVIFEGIIWRSWQGILSKNIETCWPLILTCIKLVIYLKIIYHIMKTIKKNPRKIVFRLLHGHLILSPFGF